MINAPTIPGLYRSSPKSSRTLHACALSPYEQRIADKTMLKWINFNVSCRRPKTFLFVECYNISNNCFHITDIFAETSMLWNIPQHPLSYKLCIMLYFLSFYTILTYSNLIIFIYFLYLMKIFLFILIYIATTGFSLGTSNCK